MKKIIIIAIVCASSFFISRHMKIDVLSHVKKIAIVDSIDSKTPVEDVIRIADTGINALRTETSRALSLIDKINESNYEKTPLELASKLDDIQSRLTNEIDYAYRMYDKYIQILDDSDKKSAEIKEKYKGFGEEYFEAIQRSNEIREKVKDHRLKLNSLPTEIIELRSKIISTVEFYTQSSFSKKDTAEKIKQFILKEINALPEIKSALEDKSSSDIDDESVDEDF